jgi:hypothetical protein
MAGHSFLHRAELSLNVTWKEQTNKETNCPIKDSAFMDFTTQLKLPSFYKYVATGGKKTPWPSDRRLSAKLVPTCCG